MRDEDSLRTAFALLEEQAPTKINVPGPPRRHRPRATAQLVAIAAAVVVVAVGAPLLARNGSGRPSTPAAAAPISNPGFQCASTPARTTGDVLRFGVGFSALPGLDSQQGQWVCAAASGGWIDYPVAWKNGSNLSATFNAFRPGQFDPTMVRRGDPITVAGHRAYYYAFNHLYFGQGQANGSRPVSVPSGRHVAVGHERHRGVAWEYAPNAWAVLDQRQFVSASAPNNGDEPALRPALVRMAGAIHPGGTDPLLVPFRLGYLPAGLRPTAAWSQLVLPLRDGEYNGGTVYLAPTGSAAQPAPVSVSVQRGAQPGERLTINGHPATFSREGVDTTVLDVDYGDGRVLDIRAQPGSISRAEMVKIAKNATVLGGLASKAHWIGVQQALPR